MRREYRIRQLLAERRAYLDSLTHYDLLGDALDELRDRVIQEKVSRYEARLRKAQPQYGEDEIQRHCLNFANKLRDLTDEEIIGDELETLRQETIEMLLNAYQAELDNASDEELDC